MQQSLKALANDLYDKLEYHVEYSPDGAWLGDCVDRAVFVSLIASAYAAGQEESVRNTADANIRNAIAGLVDNARTQERERCIEVVRNLGWRSDASDAMRVAATTIIHALRALPVAAPPPHPNQDG